MTDVETVMTEEEIEIMVVEEVETEMEEIEKVAIDAAEEMIGKYSHNQNFTNFF